MILWGFLSLLILVDCVGVVCGGTTRRRQQRDDFVDNKSATAAAGANDTLELVEAVWRHGERAPFRFFKNDKAGDARAWPLGLGRLTAKGMESVFKLGKKLARRYISELKLLSRTYNGDEVNVRSTNIDRTLVSAVSNLVGFYSNFADENPHHPNITTTAGGGGGWPVPFMPIAVHSRALEQEYMGNIDSGAKCERRLKLTALMHRTREYRHLVEDNSEFFTELSKLCGEPIAIETMFDLNDYLILVAMENRIPSWATDQIIQRIANISDWVDRFDFAQGIDSAAQSEVDLAEEFMRIRAGPLISDIGDRLRAKAKWLSVAGNNDTKPFVESSGDADISRLKYSAFSAHDSTLAAAQKFLGVEFWKWLRPPHATALTFELWRRGSETTAPEFYVKVLLWLPSEDAARDITAQVRGCDGGVCSLTHFMTMVEDVRPNPSIQTLCAMSTFDAATNSVVGPAEGIPIFWMLSISTSFFLFNLQKQNK